MKNRSVIDLSIDELNDENLCRIAFGLVELGGHWYRIQQATERSKQVHVLNLIEVDDPRSRERDDVENWISRHGLHTVMEGVRTYARKLMTLQDYYYFGNSLSEVERAFRASAARGRAS